MNFFTLTKFGRTLVKMTALLALLAGVSAAGVKYVAVVETDVDAQSGASTSINPAEVREITAELRRQASQNLPLGKYSVMTAETIQSMGGAVLEECAEENCVIALGSKIGADYIIRGTISKFQTRFTLAIELYETDNGTLIVSSDAVRSENLGELLDKAAVACANMCKVFVDGQKAAQPSQETAAREAATHAGLTVTAPGGSETSRQKIYKPRERNRYFSIKYDLARIPLGFDLEWGRWFGKDSIFWGVDLGGGVGMAGSNSFGGGVGLSCGYTLTSQKLPHGLRVIPGVSAGYWLNLAEKETVVDGYNSIESSGSDDFFGPFLKVQWKYIEIMYRGLLGSYSRDDEDNDGNWIEKKGFGWNQHQVLIGIYFKR